MTVEPEMLVAFDREVTFPQSSGMLRRVAGPSFTVPAAETLTWFDPLDGEPSVVSQVASGLLQTYATAVEWHHAGAPSGAAVGVGDPAAVAVWDTASPDDPLQSFSTDRGMGCLVLTRHQEQVAERLRHLPEAFAALAAVRESLVHPLDVDGQVVGVAFHCGMGASTNAVHVGRDASGQVVALLADLDLLTRAEIA